MKQEKYKELHKNNTNNGVISLTFHVKMGLSLFHVSEFPVRVFRRTEAAAGIFCVDFLLRVTEGTTIIDTLAEILFCSFMLHKADEIISCGCFLGVKIF